MNSILKNITLYIFFLTIIFIALKIVIFNFLAIIYYQPSCINYITIVSFKTKIKIHTCDSMTLLDEKVSLNFHLLDPSSHLILMTCLDMLSEFNQRDSRRLIFFLPSVSSVQNPFKAWAPKLNQIPHTFQLNTTNECQCCPINNMELAKLFLSYLPIHH